MDKVHPLALGSVYRAREQIKMLSQKLLSRNIKDETKRNRIIDTLTKALYSHDYIIARTEAKELIDLPIKLDEKAESIIAKLFELYMNDMELTVPFIPDIEKNKADKKPDKINTYYRAFVESEDECYAFVTQRQFEEFNITRPGIPLPEKAIRQKNIYEGWRRENE